jgi:hypothetical protein
MPRPRSILSFSILARISAPYLVFLARTSAFSISIRSRGRAVPKNFAASLRPRSIRPSKRFNTCAMVCFIGERKTAAEIVCFARFSASVPVKNRKREFLAISTPVCRPVKRNASTSSACFAALTTLMSCRSPLERGSLSSRGIAMTRTGKPFVYCSR